MYSYLLELPSLLEEKGIRLPIAGASVAREQEMQQEGVQKVLDPGYRDQELLAFLAEQGQEEDAMLEVTLRSLSLSDSLSEEFSAPELALAENRDNDNEDGFEIVNTEDGYEIVEYSLNNPLLRWAIHFMFRPVDELSTYEVQGFYMSVFLMYSAT